MEGRPLLPMVYQVATLARNIDITQMPAPSFMAVIIGIGRHAYQRKGGVYVIPIGCLRD